MGNVSGITIGIKCAPEEGYFRAVRQAGLEAVELYLSAEILRDTEGIIRLCNGYPFRYSIHASGEGYDPEGVARISKAIGAEVAVFHNVFFDDEGFMNFIRLASHVHMSGYTFGSDKWHTHIHNSPENGKRLLGLLREGGYSGLVISEARKSLQTYEEFKRLNDFVGSWEQSA
ncbi:MAG: hypothetical protein Q8J64_07640 [Thermodesulfovibrionales bacterium]|nr:hypothetical protein [Thermodesulfovibrionales bacterium]